MKNINLIGLAFLFITCFCSACTEPKDVSIVFVFDKPLSNIESGYPEYFTEIAQPYEVDCEDGKKGVLPKPVKVARLDINKKEVETNAWFFQDVGENTVDFSKSWLDIYFQDSLPPSYLSEPTVSTANVDAFITKNKGNTFIYSELVDAGEYKGAKIFNETTEVLNEIKSKACNSDFTKAYVLINPKLNVSEVFDEPVDDEVEVTNPMLSDEINFIANRKGDQGSRLSKAKDIFPNYFEEGAKVVEVTSEGRPLNGGANGFPLVKDWLKTLAYSRTIEGVEIKEEKKSSNGVISELTVWETHRGDENY